MNMPIITREKATVWRAENGRRYLSRRAAADATARMRMYRDHAPGDESDGFAPCWCHGCSDIFGEVRRRYARWILRATKAQR